MDTLKTNLHVYNFNTDNADEKAAYAALREKLRGLGLKCFETHGGSSHYCPDLAGEIELEAKCLFDDQWNTAPILRAASKAAELGARVFDWAQDSRYCFHNARTNIKRGHWIEQTPEMREARRNRMACGYCGRQEPAQKGYVFCPHCIDSEYLKATDLHLTRMRAVDDTADRAPLTEAESAHLLPLYRDAQRNGATKRGKARIEKARADVANNYAAAIRKAEAEKAGGEWLLDHAPGLLANWIYYDHTEKHCFGWRTPIDANDQGELETLLATFPGTYEIKTA